MSEVTLKVTAVADTGAQVCVAGPTLMVSLGLKPVQLKCRAGIRDLTKIPLTSLGAALCRISFSGRSTVQEIHFIESVERMYLSFTTCKDLGLVHSDFPQPSPLVASMGLVGEDGSDGSSDIPARPTSMPFQPLEENVACLEEWLL